MIKEQWKLFTEYVSNEFGISEELLNYVAVEEILSCCATGLSNKTIANVCNCDIKYVIEVINEFFNFNGWKDDLDINTYHIYESSGKLLDSYRMLVKLVSSVSEDIDINKSFNICKKYEEILEKVNNYYG
jgi:hypothetical protein